MVKETLGDGDGSAAKGLVKRKGDICGMGRQFAAEGTFRNTGSLLDGISRPD